MENWDDYSNLITNNNFVKEGIRIARTLGAKEIYIGGSSVYGALAAYSTGRHHLQTDVDIIVDEIRYPLNLPFGWICRNTDTQDLRATKWDAAEWAYGIPRVVKGAIEVDLIELHKLSGITDSGTDGPTINDYLTCTGLDIQSIVYDVQHKKLWGDIGISALDSRTIGVNHLEAAYVQGIRRNCTVDKYVQSMSKRLGFEPRVRDYATTSPQ